MIQMITTNNAATTTSARQIGKVLTISYITCPTLDATMNSTDNSTNMNTFKAFDTTNLSCFIVDTFLNTAIANHSYNTADSSTTG